jgi:hypothetical protein
VKAITTALYFSARQPHHAYVRAPHRYIETDDGTFPSNSSLVLAGVPFDE